MMTLTPPPPDSLVRESVDRVAADLFARIERRQRHPRRRRVLLGIGGLTLAAVLVGGGGAVAGVWHLPGSAQDAAVSSWQKVEGSGSTVLDLADAPSEATWLSLRFSCLSAGEVEFSLGGSTSVGIDCAPGDAPNTSSGSPTFPLEPGKPRLTVTAAPGVRWRGEYRFIDRQWTPWKVNANGQTYGVPRDGVFPDLEAVGDANGNVAYVVTKDELAVPDDLPDNPTQAEIDAWNSKHASDVLTLPAYESDGVTVVGEWVTGGDDAGLTLSDK